MSGDHSPSNRPIWLAIILITAVLTAAATAVVFRMVGATATDMLTSTGTAFVATVTLGMAMRNFLAG